jgi:hypothetical protein
MATCPRNRRAVPSSAVLSTYNRSLTQPRAPRNFFTTGFAFGVAYPDKPFALAIGIVIFCAAIELAQRWAPGRHARLSDFIVDAAAACIGLGAAFVAARFSGYKRRP